MKIAVCDDEQLFTDNICSLLEAWGKKNALQLTLFCFTNGDDLIDAHRNSCMDLIILDVVMPLLNGIETAKELRYSDAAVPIIFLTSARDFAVDSYDVKALHYLLKPVDETKLYHVLDDFLKTFHLSNHAFSARTAGGFYKILIANVDYLEAQNKKVRVYFQDGKSIEICEQFSKCEEVFSIENGFYRCHRSYIVNLNSIERFTKTMLVTNNFAEIPISRNSYMAFKEAYFNYMFD